MHRHTWRLAQDRMVLVLAVTGVAFCPAVQPALEETVAEVPAARALEQVPADRRHVPKLRRRGLTDGLGQGRVPLADRRMVLDLAQRRQRSDGDPVGRLL